MSTIQRECQQIPAFAVPSSAGTTRGIPFGNFAGGTVRFVSGSLATITWYSGDGLNGPWRKLQDGASTDATTVVGSGLAAPINVNCFGCKFILPVGDATGVINIDLKG